ncbi:vanin-like protein 1 [Uranotaenia lowii]|uniref:vanin-like protein 1 n=1 Tax=Uranotaenia lowii TaxID=190385 RepID=UPI0024793A79|nr:vanin-like protein 1 [Uranotaenia lowii]
MKVLKVLVTILCGVVLSEQVSSPSDDHYWAAVVEYEYTNFETDSSEVYTAKSLQRYSDIILSKEVDPVDILVFSEYGLSDTGMGSRVPDPGEGIVPCDSPEYGISVRNLSCLARDRQKYLVVNLAEIASCPMKGETRPCAKNGLYNFNSNVVFDRNGAVIARYRKFNLYNEPKMNITLEADLSVFKTDFGVEFGTFICFDLLFEKPALQLVRRGIKDFVYSTMWFSDLPFLTAVQIQQGWAYANNVNFLVSGSNNPGIGSTGSGIYSGRRGPIVSYISYKNETKLYVAKVPKIDRTNAMVSKHQSTRYSPSEMAGMKTTRDQVETYVSENLPLVSHKNYKTSLCQQDVCCNFTIDYSVNNVVNESNFYHYKLAAGDTSRSVNGFADIYITTCAIMACSGSRPADCAVRFKNPSEVAEVIRFNSIEIEGVFGGNDEEVSLVPSNVDTSMLPLEVDEFHFSHKYNQPYHQVHYQLTKPRSDIFTFAIWGRRYKGVSRATKMFAFCAPLIYSALLTNLYN